MQVLLRDRLSSLYYAGSGTFTSDPTYAADFRHIGYATRFAFDANLLTMEIILHYTSPPCQMTLPLVADFANTDSDPPLPEAA